MRENFLHIPASGKPQLENVPYGDLENLLFFVRVIFQAKQPEIPLQLQANQVKKATNHKTQVPGFISSGPHGSRLFQEEVFHSCSIKRDYYAGYADLSISHKHNSKVIKVTNAHSSPMETTFLQILSILKKNQLISLPLHIVINTGVHKITLLF